MNSEAVAHYFAQFAFVLAGLGLPWFWLRQMRSAFATGEIFAPVLPFFFGRSSRRDEPFTFWTSVMYWTVLAGVAEAVIVGLLWGSFTGQIR